MKTAFALLFAPLAVVYSLEGDAEVFNLNFEAKSGLALRGANNIKQCYNHCKRHNGKSTEWKSLCMQRCDDEYGPANPGWNGYCDGSPQYHCYSNGWPDCCEQNDGLNCPRKPPACDVQPSGHSCNRSCRNNSDCMSYQRGGFVQCAKCGQYEGARHYQMCYSGDDEVEAAEPVAEYCTLRSPAIRATGRAVPIPTACRTNTAGSSNAPNAASTKAHGTISYATLETTKTRPPSPLPSMLRTTDLSGMTSRMERRRRGTMLRMGRRRWLTNLPNGRRTPQTKQPTQREKRPRRPKTGARRHSNPAPDIMPLHVLCSLRVYTPFQSFLLRYR